VVACALGELFSLFGFAPVLLCSEIHGAGPDCTPEFTLGLEQATEVGQFKLSHWLSQIRPLGIKQASTQPAALA